MPKRIEAVLGESAEAATQRLLDRIRTYVEIESPSRHEDGIRRLGDVIAGDLKTAGASIEIIDAPGYGVHIVASFQGETTEAPVVILSHMDTVHPVGTLATQPFKVGNGRAEGPGIYDMKAGIGVAVEAFGLLARASRKPRRPVHFLITSDEEIGTQSSMPVIEKYARGSAAVLVTEPCISGGLAKTQRKGVLTYRVDAKGRASHAGVSPQTGVNAILELCKQIERIYAMARPDLGTTMNAGVIAGGTASNVVAAHAWAEIDVRVVNMAEGARVHQELMKITPITEGANVTVEQTESRPPLERTPAVVGLYERARDVAKELGVEMGEGASGGGSDGSLTAAMGLATLDGLGPDGGGAHAADEHILITDLPYRLALFARLLERL